MFSPSHSVVHQPSSRQTSNFHFALHHFGAVTVSLLNPSLKQNPRSLGIQIYQSEMTWLAFPRTLHHWCGPLLTINLQRSYKAIRLWKIFLASAHLYCVLVRCNECIHLTNKLIACKVRANGPRFVLLLMFCFTFRGKCSEALAPLNLHLISHSSLVFVMQFVFPKFHTPYHVFCDWYIANGIFISQSICL